MLPADDPEYYAAALGVALGTLRAGMAGVANCKPEITFEQASQGAVVRVAGTVGLSNICIVMAIASVEQPRPGLSYANVAVACPPSSSVSQPL
jgi:hypothetical protein